MKRIIFFIFWAIISSTAFAQEKGIDPFVEIKINQVLNALSNNLDRLSAIENNISEFSGLSAGLEGMRQDLESLATKLTKLDGLEQEFQNLSGVKEELQALNQLFADFKEDLGVIDDRLNYVEVYIEIIVAHANIVKDEQGNARIFTPDTIDDLSVNLPIISSCEALGQALEDYPQRAYNAFFVRSQSGALRLCKRLGGAWELFEANKFENGHVIAAK